MAPESARRVHLELPEARLTAQHTLTMEPAEGERLSVSSLEQWLWDAACVIRGATDVPKFSESA